MENKTQETLVRELPKCCSCGVPIFKAGTFPLGECLPGRLTMGNCMMVVYYHNQRLEVCANCRYDKYAAW